MRDHVLLYINGSRQEVRGSQAFQPLSELLRTTNRLTGTKVVCAEGDCGSCTVLIGRPRGGRIDYQPVTSCIQYVAQLDATHVVTVEGLTSDSDLSPTQQAMVEQHGAQCGFCTPGMIVSLAGLFDRTPEPTRHEVCRALVGNLCRCTGYDSILQAATHVNRASHRSLDELYPSREMAAVLAKAAGESVEVADGSRRLFKPTTLAEAIRFRAAVPGAVVLAGGTDLGVVWNKGRREVTTLLCIGELTELGGCEVADGVWSIGAAATIAEIERAALEVLPEYGRMLERFGSPPIKNAGTLGGNLANGSPIGDTMPTLMVLNSAVELAGPAGVRQVKMNEFYTGYRKSVLRPDELIRRVLVPLPAADDLFAVYKISKRRDLDISSFTAAIWLRMDRGAIGEARIAYGGVAPTIVRLPKTERWLAGRQLTEATLRQAGKLASQEISPISDVRGSAQYRRQLAENILVKFGREKASRQSLVGSPQE